MHKKIEGYQSPAIQVIPDGADTHVIATIEIKGCVFTGLATWDRGRAGIQDAVSEARRLALADAEKSDFKLFRQTATGGGWGGKRGPGKPQDPAATADRGYIGRLFAVSMKEKGWARQDVTGKIACITGLPYARDCEYELTNGQAAELETAIQKNEKPDPGQVPQNAKLAEKNRLQKAAKAKGLDTDQLNAWLGKHRPGCNLGRITSKMAITAAEKLEAK